MSSRRYDNSQDYSSDRAYAGHKRDYKGSHRNPRFSGPSSEHEPAVKLFVGSVPRTCREEEIRPMFEEYGKVVEVALIKDKVTGLQRGCCFVKYSTLEEAERAISGLNNVRTLPGSNSPIQVRLADGERERLGVEEASEYKLFVGCLGKHTTEEQIEAIFSKYGSVDDVYIMKDSEKKSRGCAFVKYSSKAVAQAAIDGLHGTFTVEGMDQPLAVRFADPKKQRPGETRVGGPGASPGQPRSPFYGDQRPMPGARQPPGGGGGWRQMGGPGSPMSNMPPAGYRPQPGMGPGGHLPSPHSQPQLQPPQQGYMPAQHQQPSSYYQPPPVQQQQQPPHMGYAPPQQQQQQQQQQALQSSQQQPLGMQQAYYPPPAQAQGLGQAPLQSQMPPQMSSQLQPPSQPQSGSWAGPYAPPLSSPVPPPPPVQPPPALTCDWTEHTSPEGHKYYYNSVTRESKWEKPLELISFEMSKQQALGKLPQQQQGHMAHNGGYAPGPYNGQPGAPSHHGQQQGGGMYSQPGGYQSQPPMGYGNPSQSNGGGGQWS